MEVEEHINDGAALRAEFARFIKPNSALFSGDILCRDGEANGQTGFFRHWAIQRALIWALTHRNISQTFHILAAPCSIGAETYSFSALACELAGNARFQFVALDQNINFIRIARQGLYPYFSQIVALGENWRDCAFDKEFNEDGLLVVREKVKNRVRFLDAQAFEDHVPDHNYDAVFISNLFQYMNATQKSKSFNVIANTGAQIVITTREGFDTNIPDSFPYIPINEHPRWVGLELADNNYFNKDYVVLARKSCAPV